MAVILSLPSLYGGNWKTKIPLLHNNKIRHRTDAHPPQARFTYTQALQSCRVSSASESLEAHDTHWSDWCPPPSDRPSVISCTHFGLRSWLCGSTNELIGFVANHCKPHRLGATSTQIPLMTWYPLSPWLRLGFEAQLRNRTRHHLALLATVRSALDPVSHWVPRTRHTCLSTMEATSA
jgi:hypothetical protein